MYEVKVIRDSVVYAKEEEIISQLLGFYYLIAYKSYPKEKNN